MEKVVTARAVAVRTRKDHAATVGRAEAAAEGANSATIEAVMMETTRKEVARAGEVGARAARVAAVAQANSTMVRRRTEAARKEVRKRATCC